MRIVGLPHKTCPASEAVGNTHPVRKVFLIQVSGEQVEEIIDGSGLYLDIPIHIGFG